MDSYCRRNRRFPVLICPTATEATSIHRGPATAHYTKYVNLQDDKVVSGSAVYRPRCLRRGSPMPIYDYPERRRRPDAPQHEHARIQHRAYSVLSMRPSVVLCRPVCAGIDATRKQCAENDTEQRKVPPPRYTNATQKHPKRQSNSRYDDERDERCDRQAENPTAQ